MSDEGFDVKSRAPSRSAIALSLLATGCGGGTAAVLGGMQDDDSSTRTVVEIEVVELDRVPASIFLNAIGPSGTTSVNVYYRKDVEVDAHLASLTEPDTLSPVSQPLTLDVAPAGAVRKLGWNFRLDLASSTLSERVRVFVIPAGRDPVEFPDEVLDVTEGIVVLLDPVAPDVPRVFVDSPLGASPIATFQPVPISFRVEDAEEDRFHMRVEFAVPDSNGDFPADDSETGWTRVRPSGAAATPDFALTNRRSDPPGLVPGTLFGVSWDAPFDLALAQTPVRLRLSPFEVTQVTNELGQTELVVGRPGVRAVTATIEVDASELRIVPDVVGIAQSADGSGGIALPYVLFGDSLDARGLFFQWRRPEQGGALGFDAPELRLPLDDVPALDAILRDPALRRARQICSELPSVYSGAASVRGVSDASRSVRLTELAGPSASAPLANGGIVGKTLEILRGRELAVVTGAWAPRRPACVLPIRGGPSALVLDAPSDGKWRLRELDLVTGEELDVVVPSADGDASALALEPGGASLLVASDVSGAWLVERVDLALGTRTELASHEPSLEGGTVRGIVSLGPTRALLSVASSLVRLDFGVLPGQARALLAPGAASAGLRSPWGLARDPNDAARVFVAERDWIDPRTAEAVGRVFRLDVDSLVTTPVAAVGLAHPESIALEPGGRVLLAVTDEGDDGQRELRGVALGLGDALAFDVAATLPPGRVGQVASAGGARCLALTDADAIAVSGGVEQARVIGSYDPLRREAALAAGEAPFAPAVGEGAPWRIRDVARPRPSPLGARGIWVWDSRADAAAGTIAVLRAVVVGEAEGVASQEFVKRMTAPYVAPAAPTLPTPDSPSELAAGDVDGDGDEDVVYSVGTTSTTNTVVLLQDAGSLGPAPTSPVASASGFASGLATGDLDADGDLDIVRGDFARGVVIFVQQTPGVFVEAAALGDASTDFVFDVALADFDADGDLDVAAGRGFFGPILVWRQGPPLAFTSTPLTTSLFPDLLEACDVDGDGRVDLVAAESFGGALEVLLQDAAGGFTSRRLEDVVQTTAIALADATGDGRADVLIARSDDAPALYRQRPDGTFDAAVAVHSIASGSVDLAVPDLDGDADSDLVVANGEGRTTVFVQTAEGALTPMLDDGSEPAYVSFLAAIANGDLDGDGDADLVVADRTFASSHVTVFSRGPAPLFAGASSAGAPLDADELVSADFDGDGALDLAAGWRGFVDAEAGEGGAPSRVSLFTNQRGVLQPRAVMEFDTAAFSDLAATDLDGDGDLDLAFAVDGFNEGPQIVPIVQDAGVFAPRTPLDATLLPGIRSLAAGDLDLDGVDELVASNSDSASSIVVVRRDAGGNLVQAEGPYSDGSMRGTQDLCLADFDRDGLLDVVTCNGSSDSISVFLRGSGQYTARPALSGLSAPRRAALVDVFGDRHVDLVGANAGSISLFLGDGETPFVPRSTLTSPAATWSDLVVGDASGDGLADVLVSSSSGAPAFVQTPRGGFTVRASGIGTSSSVLALADFDGDGALDLARTASGILLTHPGTR